MSGATKDDIAVTSRMPMALKAGYLTTSLTTRLPAASGCVLPDREATMNGARTGDRGAGGVEQAHSVPNLLRPAHKDWACCPPGS